MRIIYRTISGGCEISEPLEPIILNLIGSGDPFFTQERIELEINRRVKVDKLREEDVRPYFEGMAKGGFSREEAIHLIAGLSKQPHHVSYRLADLAKIPYFYKIFFEAWHDENPNTETVDIDLVKAKEIKKNHLRILRKPKLEALDMEAVNKLSNGKSIIEIEDEKQLLRDVTKSELPDDLEELKNFIPEVLI